MVAISRDTTERYLKAPPKGVSAILLYGDDAGLVSERASAVAKVMAAQASPPGEILRLDDPDLEGDPDRLAVELGTVPMFGGRKIVRTQQSRRVTAALLKPFVQGPPLEGVLIVEAGGLRKEDAMRKLFEEAQSAAAIACFGDEARDLDGLVRDVLAVHKLDIAPDARRLLISRLGADRALSRAEIEKLALYALGSARIEEADVEAVVGDASEMAIDRVVTAAITGQMQAAMIECDKALAAGESAAYMIIATERQLHRLHRVRLAVESGSSMDDALKGIRPPLFSRARDQFVRQLEQWSAARLTRALARITEGQRLARGGGPLGVLEEATIVQGVLLDVARLAAFRERG